jgi:hypothetical protein
MLCEALAHTTTEPQRKMLFNLGFVVNAATPTGATIYIMAIL